MIGVYYGERWRHQLGCCRRKKRKALSTSTLRLARFVKSRRFRFRRLTEDLIGIVSACAAHL